MTGVQLSKQGRKKYHSYNNNNNSSIIYYFLSPVFLNGFSSNSSLLNGRPVFGLIGGVVGFFVTPAPEKIMVRKREEIMVRIVELNGRINISFG